MDSSRRRLAQYASRLLASGSSHSEVCRQLAAFLIASGRQKQHRLLADDVAYELETAGLAAHVKITTAKPLAESSRQKLVAQIISSIGVDKVAVEEIIDHSIVGGARIETAVRSWDNTVIRQLSDMRRGF